MSPVICFVAFHLTYWLLLRHQSTYGMVHHHHHHLRANPLLFFLSLARIFDASSRPVNDVPLFFPPAESFFYDPWNEMSPRCAIYDLKARKSLDHGWPQFISSSFGVWKQHPQNEPRFFQRRAGALSKTPTSLSLVHYFFIDSYWLHSNRTDLAMLAIWYAGRPSRESTRQHLLPIKSPDPSKDQYGSPDV